MGFIFWVNIVIVFRILNQYKTKFLQEERGLCTMQVLILCEAVYECHRGEIRLRVERDKEEKWFGNLQTQNNNR